MSQHEPGASARTWLRWEWYASLITIIGGLLIANGIAAYLLWPRAENELAISGQPIHRTAAETAKVNAEAALALCSAALNDAKAYGIVPQFGRLASPKLEVTQVRGRYKCLAATEAAKYVIATDLVCRDLRDRRCVVLYSVTQDDGTVLYQRQG